jgi:hypothetical protein
MSSEKLTKDRLRRAILQEFKMLGMGSPAPMKMKSLSHCDTGVEPEPVELSHMDPNDAFGMGVHTAGHASEGSVSRESCCEAVMCMVECCACPVTKAALIECCQAIMSGEYDQ